MESACSSTAITGKDDDDRWGRKGGMLITMEMASEMNPLPRIPAEWDLFLANVEEVFSWLRLKFQNAYWYIISIGCFQFPKAVSVIWVIVSEIRRMFEEILSNRKHLS